MNEIIRVGGMNITFLMTRHETGDALDLLELTIPPGDSVVVPHTHLNYDEWVMGLNGITTWTLNGQIQLLRPGENIFIPRGTPHFFANLHEEMSRFVCLQTPGVMGPEYYREIARHYEYEHVDPAGIRDVMCRYGVDPLMRCPDATGIEVA